MKFWKLWILVIAVVSGPWFGITARPQWDRVTWIPFTGKEDKPTDMAANVLLFVPLGWSFMSRRSGRRGVLRTIAVAAVVSFSVEAPQLFFVLRDPSATDVLMGICGAAVGAGLSRASIGVWHRATPRTTSTN
jgi:glycopeptide antibiotics resistance protein